MTREEALKQIREWDFLNDEERAALETLIPELCESEDERIRKIIIKHFEEIANKNEQSWINLDIPYILAYLERQKERGPLTKEEEYELHRIIEFLEDETCPSKWISLLHDISCLPYQKYDEQKEQKLHLTVSGKEVYKICPRCKSRMIRDDSKVYTSMPPQYGYECPKCGEMEFDTVKYDNPEMEEQKPAEWSKNDTVFLNEITDFFENKTTRLQHDIDMYAHWLKSLPERFNLQPKQEWSEEDEKMRNLIIETLDDDSHYFPFKETKKKMMGWLKSLRPSWKPSEEQMDRLFSIVAALRKDYCDDMADFLASLYKQLKKLM